MCLMLPAHSCISIASTTVSHFAVSIYLCVAVTASSHKYQFQIVYKARSVWLDNRGDAHSIYSITYTDGWDQFFRWGSVDPSLESRSIDLLDLDLGFGIWDLGFGIDLLDLDSGIIDPGSQIYIPCSIARAKPGVLFLH